MKEQKKTVVGTVTGIEPYGIFLKIDENTSGLIHISEISDKYVKNPGSFASIGEKIEAEIIEQKDNGQVKLSIKNLNNHKNNKKKKIVETPLGFNTLSYKLPLWIEENLKNHKNNLNSIDK